MACYADLRTLHIVVDKIAPICASRKTIYKQTHVFLIAEIEVFIETGPGTIAEGGSRDICVRLEHVDGTPTFLDRDLTVFLSTTNGKAGMTFMHCNKSKGSLRDKYVYICT